MAAGYYNMMEGNLGTLAGMTYYETSYGHSFGYNERARDYHRNYGLVSSAADRRFARSTDELATAPLYRRDAFGHRRDFIDRPGIEGVQQSQQRSLSRSLGDTSNDGQPATRSILSASGAMYMNHQTAANASWGVSKHIEASNSHHDNNHWADSIGTRSLGNSGAIGGVSAPSSSSAAVTTSAAAHQAALAAHEAVSVRSLPTNTEFKSSSSRSGSFTGSPSSTSGSDAYHDRYRVPVNAVRQPVFHTSTSSSIPSLSASSASFVRSDLSATAGRRRAY